MNVLQIACFLLPHTHTHTQTHTHTRTHTRRERERERARARVCVREKRRGETRPVEYLATHSAQPLLLSKSRSGWRLHRNSKRNDASQRRLSHSLVALSQSPTLSIRYYLKVEYRSPARAGGAGRSMMFQWHAMARRPFPAPPAHRERHAHTYVHTRAGREGDEARRDQ